MAHMPAAPAKLPANTGRTFVLAIFVVGAVVTVAVGYLGVAGALDGGIVGTHPNGIAPSPPLTSCQGHGRMGAFYFSIVAGAKGEGSFNATSPGPCFAVAVGSTVTLNFSVSTNSNRSDSWALVRSTGPVTQVPVFSGAGFANATATTGLRPGEHHLFLFTVNAPGEYRYVSQVDGHAAAGMWGPFNVTLQALASNATSAARPMASLYPPTNFALVLRDPSA